MSAPRPHHVRRLYWVYLATLMPFLLVGFLIGWHASHDRLLLAAVGLLLAGFAHTLAMWCVAFLLRGRFAKTTPN